MAIESKPNKVPKPQPLQLRDNEKVKARIAAYKEANPQDVIYYTRLVNEHPQRAVDSLILKDINRNDNIMRRMTRQIQVARNYFEKQSPENQARIEADLASNEPTPRQGTILGFFRRNRQSAAPEVETGKVVTMPGQGAPKLSA